MKRNLIKPGLTLVLAASLMLGIAACSNSANSENNPTPQPTDSTQPPQSEAKLNPDDPAWKLDTSPVDLTWFVGANWYAHTWGDSLTSKYVTEKQA